MKRFGLDLRVLKSPDEKMQGYQNAQQPSKGNGLLFVFNPPEKPNFHMRNVSFPLQITFFDAAWRPLKKAVMEPETGRSGCDEFCSYAIECNPDDIALDVDRTAEGQGGGGGGGGSGGGSGGSGGGGSGGGGTGGDGGAPSAPTGAPPPGTFQSLPAPTWRKSKTLKVDMDVSPDFQSWWKHKGKAALRAMRIGETAQFCPNFGPNINWTGPEVPLAKEKIPKFNEWWKRPGRYMKQRRSRDNENQRTLNFGSLRVGESKIVK